MNLRPNQNRRRQPLKSTSRPAKPRHAPPPKGTRKLPRTRPWAASCRDARLRYSSATLARCLAVLDAQPGPCPSAGEISLAFLTGAELAGLHETFLDDPSPTDVITFPADPAADFAGEICMSVDEAKLQAVRRKLPFARELTLYLVHGWLHLCGYDDHSAADRRIMRQMERRLLKALERTQALPDFRLI